MKQNKTTKNHNIAKTENTEQNKKKQRHIKNNLTKHKYIKTQNELQFKTKHTQKTNEKFKTQ